MKRQIPFSQLLLLLLVIAAACCGSVTNDAPRSCAHIPYLCLPPTLLKKALLAPIFSFFFFSLSLSLALPHSRLLAAGLVSPDFAWLGPAARSRHVNRASYHHEATGVGRTLGGSLNGASFLDREIWPLAEMGDDDVEDDDVAPNNEQYHRTVVTLAQTANYLPARNNYLRRRFPLFP
jgi:hypothetical protein